MLTRKRQLERDKKDLKKLENGGHISFIIGKNRRAARDKKDMEGLKRRIKTNESVLDAKSKMKEAKKAAKEANKAYTKAANKMTNHTYTHIISNRIKGSDSRKKQEQLDNDFYQKLLSSVKADSTYKKAKKAYKKAKRRY